MTHWIDLPGFANLRDVGGLTGRLGTIGERRLWRGDNLQGLPDGTVQALLDAGLTDIVDLRTDEEVRVEGSNALTGKRPHYHHHSFMPHWVHVIKDEGLPGEHVARELPRVDLPPFTSDVARGYAAMTLTRVEAMIAALRAIANAEGLALVHCAAGKDRTGIATAMALLICGVEKEQVVADFAASGERAEQILDRLKDQPAYRDGLKGSNAAEHTNTAPMLEEYLEWLGDPETYLRQHGWTDEDTARLRAKLLA